MLTWPEPGVRTLDGSADARRLADEVTRVRRLLWEDPPTSDDATGAEAPDGADLAGPTATALDDVVARFGLTSFERDILLGAVAVELDPALAPLTFQQALAVLPEPHWSATLPERPLRAARLLVMADGPLLGSYLRADERIVHHLQGVDTLDERLAAYVVPAPAPAERMPASRREAASALRALWEDGAHACLVHGPDRADRQDVVALAAAAVGAEAWRLPAGDLPGTAAERDAFARLWTRESVLTGAVLIIDLADPTPDTVNAVGAFVTRASVALAVSAEASMTISGVVAELLVPRPSHAEQSALWRRILPGPDRTGPDAEGLATALADEFHFGHDDILRSPIQLDGERHDEGSAPRRDSTDVAAMVRRRSTAHVRHRMGVLAERLEPRAGWPDLVLPAETHRSLRLLTAAAIGRRALHHSGAGRFTSRGQGLTALFTGPSGTGKTMAAEVVAAEVGLDLYRVDLASVVSKWVGETEKHLRQVFDAAEQGGSILLFDEADALFGRRSEVRDSHDRYANLEVSYLLQRMEQYRGVAILTTNLRSAIDPAFARRLRFVVKFPHPAPDARRQLWRAALPDQMRGGDIDFERLCRLDLTGGEISTVATHAHLVANAAGEPVSMAHLRDAVAAELVKLDRSLSSLDVLG